MSNNLLTVKQVATALDIDERSVRDKLAAGTLKGVKKAVGNKDQWFIAQRDLDAELARRGMSPISQQRLVADGVAPYGSFNGGFSQQQIPETHKEVFAAPAQQMNSVVRPPDVGFSRPVESTTHFARMNVVEQSAVALQAPEATSAPTDIPEVTSGGNLRTEDDAEVVAEVTETPEVASSSSGEQRLNWLNEDMRQQLMATAEVFMKPLVDRIEVLTASDKAKDAELKAKEEELEEARRQLRLLPDFEAQKAKLLKEIEAERKAAEIQYARAQSEAEQAKALSDENERLKVKAEEAVLSAAKLEELEKVVQDLQKPKPSFWKKLWSPRQ